MTWASAAGVYGPETYPATPPWSFFWPRNDPATLPTLASALARRAYAPLYTAALGAFLSTFHATKWKT